MITHCNPAGFDTIVTRTFTVNKATLVEVAWLTSDVIWPVALFSDTPIVVNVHPLSNLLPNYRHEDVEENNTILILITNKPTVKEGSK
jgi:hypothetical protein